MSSSYVSSHIICCDLHSCRGFPVHQYEHNRPGLIIAYWGLAVLLGKVQVSQTDLASDGSVFGSVLNHITPGRWANGEGGRVTSCNPSCL